MTVCASARCARPRGLPAAPRRVQTSPESSTESLLMPKRRSAAIIPLEHSQSQRGKIRQEATAKAVSGDASKKGKKLRSMKRSSVFEDVQDNAHASLTDENKGGAADHCALDAHGCSDDARSMHHDIEGEDGLASDTMEADNSLLRLHHEGWVAETGCEILNQPDRSDKAARMFAWLVAPASVQAFDNEVRERRPMYIARSVREYYDGWLGSTEIKQLLSEQKLKWTEEIDVTNYVNGKRQTLNAEGVATASEVLPALERGCSLRLSWPQRQSPALAGLLSTLEEHFCCGAGCNAYLTPSSNQGFAPHYDDVDVFVLQVEGAKEWRVYPPPSAEDVLPFTSSVDFDETQIGEPMEVLTLRPGDLLYLPRGYVHQAKTVSVGTPSLHLTISISRRHTYRDLIELAVRGAIDAAAAMNAEWRRALPRDYLSFTGAVYSDRTNDSRRVAFEATVARMLGALVSNVPLDAACDQFACSNFMHERLPPHTAPADAKRLSPPNLTLKSAVRLRSRHAARLCIEDEVAVLYHHVENTTIYRELPEPAHVDFAMEAVPALDQILTSFPKYVIVGNLPLETDDQKLDVAAALVEAKLLLVK